MALFNQYKVKSSTYAKFLRIYLDPLRNNEAYCNLECCDSHSDQTFDIVTQCILSNNISYESVYEVLIVEESSMLQHNMYRLIKRFNIPIVIYVGDVNQVPPINSSCVSCANCSFNVLETPNTETFILREQWRHEESLVISIQSFMSRCTYDTFKKSHLTDIFPTKELHEILPLDSPIMSYHVERSIAINALLIGGDRPIREGDYVVIDYGKVSTLLSGVVYKVTGIVHNSRVYTELRKSFKYTTYTLANDTTKGDITIVDNKEEYIAYCTKLMRTMKTKFQYKLKKIITEHLTNISFAYAMTVHRAQGQSFEYAYLDYKNILSCKDKALRLKLIYSAITRARKEVILLNIPDYTYDCEQRLPGTDNLLQR